MANTPTKFTSTNVFAILILISSLFFPGESHPPAFSRKLSHEEVGGPKREKLTHLHFYLHDVLTGRNPTTVRVAEAAMTRTSATDFGSVLVMDDRLTLEPQPSSKQIGRAQGIYASTAQNEISYLMIYNLAFTEGNYNGSTLSVMGRNPILSDEREMPVVGGSGKFRFARGYVRPKIYWFNSTTGDAIVEYNVSVLHY